MLTEIFKGILSASLSAAPPILLMLAASPLLKKRYTPRLRHIVWLIVAIRLCLPVSLAAVPVLAIPSGEPVVYLSDDASAVAQAFAELEAAPIADSAAKGGGRLLSPLGLFAMVWLVGAGVFLTAHAAAYLHTRRKLARWSVAADDSATTELLSACAKQLGIDQTIPVYRCGTISAPLLIGLLRPAILLPSADMSAGQTRCVLLHELCHLRRRDLWFKLLLAAVLSLHWFNPLVWLMVKRAEGDMETACDAAVLNCADGVSRRDYGMAILSFMNAGRERRMPLTTGFFGGGRQTLRRFEGIMDSGIKKRGAVLIALTVAAVAVSAALVGCVGSPASAPEPQGSLIIAADPTSADPASADPSATNPAAPESASAEPQSDEAKRAALEEDIRRVHENGDGKGGGMQWAVLGDYTIIAGYGERYGDSDIHTGIDIGGDDVSGKPVIAATSGTVLAVNEESETAFGFGSHIIIDHGGKLTSLYAHLNETYVTVGQVVEVGQIIGAVGETGYAPKPHLHFEVREDGKTVDPKKYLLPE